MTARVVVAGLGPAGPELITAQVREVVERLRHRYVRTHRHPAASAVPDAASFDAVYERSATLDEVYAGIVDELVAEAGSWGEILYLVPGSPFVAERTVELLAADSRVSVELLPGLSFLDLAWARLGVDPVTAGARLVDGHRFAVEAAGERGPVLVAQCDSRPVLSEIKLAVEGPGPTVTVLQRLGSPDERVHDVAWADLDRAVEPDHLTSLWVPALTAPVAQELARFAELVRTLRERCPWDREQTHQSLTRHLLEEAYETLEAVDAMEADAGPEAAAAYDHLCEELGDLLFQVVFHATLAAEAGQFTLADVARGIHDKLVHRHPHVFGSVEATTAGQVMANWDVIKRAEKDRQSVMDGIPTALPSLLFAAKVQRRAASMGLDWDSVHGPYAKVTEELGELQADPSEEELGDLMFTVVNVARHLGVDPEAALRRAASKFRSRCMAVEVAMAERGLEAGSIGFDELDALWNQVKRDPW